MTDLDLLRRIFLLEEEGPLSGGKSFWDEVDEVTLEDLGWATKADCERLDVVDLVETLDRLRVGEVHVEDGGLRGRTRWTRRK